MTTTQTTPISVQDKVRNYQGQNRFLLNMKESLKKWGGLTPKQLAATEKVLNSEVKTIDTENLPENIKRIVDYKGENPFVKDIASSSQSGEPSPQSKSQRLSLRFRRRRTKKRQFV